VPLSGRTRLYFQLAHPIEHVRVNRLLNPLFESRGIDAMVVPLHVRPEDFDTTLPRLARLGNVHGFLATIPHKEALLRHCVAATPEARLSGAANAARIEPDGSLAAAAFDGPGLLAAAAGAGIGISGRRVLLLGAGGAARCIAVSILLAGAAALTVHNRNAERARDLAGDLARALPDRPRAVAGNSDPAGYDVVVNATALGLHPGDALPVDPERLAPGCAVIDIVIADGGTALERAARARGHPTVGGLPMLERQFDSVIEFFGV